MLDELKIERQVKLQILSRNQKALQTQLKNQTDYLWQNKFVPYFVSRVLQQYQYLLFFLWSS